MKNKEIIEKYGLDELHFERFLSMEAEKHGIRVRGMFFDAIEDEDVELAVREFKRSDFAIPAKQKEERRKQQEEKERIKAEYAKSFHDYYEYDVATVYNKKDGVVDAEILKKVLSDYASKGWKLHTMYSNELGKKALSILGFGINATASQDVMIFERRIQDDSQR